MRQEPIIKIEEGVVAIILMFVFFMTLLLSIVTTTRKNYTMRVETCAKVSKTAQEFTLCARNTVGTQ